MWSLLFVCPVPFRTGKRILPEEKKESNDYFQIFE